MSNTRTLMNLTDKIREISPGLDQFRGRFQKLVLPPSGKVPLNRGPLGREEQSATLSWIASMWQLLTIQEPETQKRSHNVTVPTGIETWLGFKRWFLSHHLFIPQLALIAHSLEEAVKASRAGDHASAWTWTDLASRMRRGCGSLFMYSVDFVPCKDIYCERIRRRMPRAFSGYEIRERHYSLQPAVAAFNCSFPQASSSDFTRKIRGLWIQADLRYHELHQLCMFQAVPVTAGQATPESLRQNYIKNNHKTPKITKTKAARYDNWFCIERKAGITRSSYIFQICDVMERIFADLMVGHRLENTVRADLFDGMKAALVVFGHWAGAVHEDSPFYPKYLRGE